jgi:hypothetical protein
LRNSSFGNKISHPSFASMVQTPIPLPVSALLSWHVVEIHSVSRLASFVLRVCLHDVLEGFSAYQLSMSRTPQVWIEHQGLVKAVETSRDAIVWLDSHDRFFDTWFLVSYSLVSCALVQVSTEPGFAYFSN